MIFQFKSSCVAERSSFIFLSGRYWIFRSIVSKHVNSPSFFPKYIYICIGITKRRETRETRESTKRVGCTQLCRKNNGSFNYRIDCLEFLSPSAILPFHSFFLFAPFVFFNIFFFSICLSILQNKVARDSSYTRSERIASSERIFDMHRSKRTWIYTYA